MKRLTLLILFWFFSGLVSVASAYADNVMRFTTSAHVAAFSDTVELINTAYSRLGYKIEIIPLPDRRAIYEARHRNWVDGELARAKDAAAILPGYIRIPVVIKTVDVSAFVKDINFNVNGWDSLLPYDLGSLRGIIAIENKLTGFKVTETGTPLQLLKMLDRERIQIAIIPKPMGVLALERLGYNIRILEPSIDSFPLYHYVSERHRLLVPELTAILSELTEEKSELN